MLRIRPVTEKLGLAPVLLLIFALSVLFWAGCASGPEPKPAASGAGVRTILVMDFVNVAEIHGEDQGVRSPVSSQAFVTGPVEKDACQFMTRQIMNHISEKTEYVPVPYEDAQGALAVSNNGSNLLTAGQICKVGRDLGVDAVVAGHVYRFKDRVGAAYSVDEPASVAFDVHMLRVEDQAFLWSLRYDETQKALSDNLLDISKFFKRGASWVTAHRLASSGLEEGLQSFPKP